MLIRTATPYVYRYLHRAFLTCLVPVPACAALVLSLSGQLDNPEGLSIDRVDYSFQDIAQGCVLLSVVAASLHLVRIDAGRWFRAMTGVLVAGYLARTTVFLLLMPHATESTVAAIRIYGSAVDLLCLSLFYAVMWSLTAGLRLEANKMWRDVSLRLPVMALVVCVLLALHAVPLTSRMMTEIDSEGTMVGGLLFVFVCMVGAANITALQATETEFRQKTAIEFAGQSRALGAMATLAGTLSCVVCGAYTVMFAANRLLGARIGGLGVPFWLGAVLCFFAILGYRLGQRLRRLGRRHLAYVLRSPEVLVPGSFSLYLRSFDEDEPFAVNRWGQRPQSGMVSFLATGRTEEEQFAAALKRVGPLVAVDADGRRVPYVGAVRMAPLGDDWREKVLEFMLNARLVVVALGTSEGVMWELAAALRRLPPERVLLVVSMSGGEYNTFRESAYATVSSLLAEASHAPWQPPPLPDYKGHDGYHPSWTAMKGLISFSANWEPVFIPVRIAEAQFITRDKPYAAFKKSLRLPLRRLRAYERRTR